MLSPSTLARSSLEEMLENLRRLDEKPKDVPPALPSRPPSRARLPSARRSLPVSFRVSDGAAGGGSGESEGKEEMGVAVKRRGESNGGVSRREEEDSRRNSFGKKKKKVKWEGESESPYAEEREGGGLTSTSKTVAEWDNNIDYFIKKKLCVWCRLPAGQWELGRIQSTSREEAFVQLSDGNSVKVSTTELLPANPDVLDGVSNLIRLGYLNEPSVLHNLQFRYSHDMVYSKAGPVLIAINPFKNIQIYGNELISAYRQKLSDSPHVYATADAAYSEMITDGVNQSIIISGESGAGKTETAKIAMQYLATLGGGGDGIEHEVLQTSCILEAFGNAKTSRNDNSSRFGKLIEIHFSITGRICGAVIQTFLLEKSRVVQLAEGERSYHVFYLLCAGASSDLRGRLNIGMANEYNYLRQSNCLTINEFDDAQKFCELKDALDVIQIPKEDQEGILAMLAAVLWLGNISFQVVDNENHVEVVTDEALMTTARLMGCSMQDLMLVLSTRKIQAGKDTIAKSLTLQQASDTRDALAKFIYASLFDWLVEQINKSLAVGKRRTGRSISILDIYGFESFQRNSFEQFCINYANERLQQHFNRHLFKLEQEDYEADGIDWTKVKFKDNQECLNLFEKKPLGLLSLLDEESNFPKATDLTFANKLTQHLNSNHCFKGGRDGIFGVHHYAGEVCYDTSGFLDKNRDRLHSDSLHLLSSCGSPLLKCFPSNMLDQSQKELGPMGPVSTLDAQKQSVATKFKGQLYRLMQRLENTTPHFIRCIKPNSKQLPGIYEKDLVLQQLRCCGVLEVVRIARSGYPTRITHQEFAKRFGFLLLDKNVFQEPLSISLAVLQQFNVLPEMYQVGYTKLYFRTGQVGALEDTRKRVLQSVVGVQSCYRGYKVRCQFHESKRRAAILQSCVRGENARRKYASLLKDHRAQAQKYKHEHKRSASQTSDEQHEAIIQLQSVIRGWLSRTRIDEAQNSGNVIESANDSRESGSKVSGIEVVPQGNVQVQTDVVEELQRRVENAEATLGKKEEENAALRSQLQQYERRWSEYEAKMRAMEEMWKQQISSLQVSLSAAKKSLAQENNAVQPGRRDDSPSPHYYDSDSNLSNGAVTPGGSTPLKYSNPNAEVGLGEANGGGLNPVNCLTKEFEQRRHGFDEDARALFEAKSGTNSYDELRRLKRRFEAWKKEYKVRLRETKVVLHKFGHVEMEKSRKKWWGKLSTKRIQN